MVSAGFSIASTIKWQALQRKEERVVILTTE